MNALILYRSKYGATRKYVNWLAEELELPFAEIQNITIEEMARYDTIIYGGGIYGTGIAGISLLRKSFRALEGRRLVVFCVGAFPCSEGALRWFARHNLKGLYPAAPCFFCRGIWDPSTMGLPDRILYRVLRGLIGRKPPEACHSWQRALLEAGDCRQDWTDRACLAPIKDYLLQNEKKPEGK